MLPTVKHAQAQILAFAILASKSLTLVTHLAYLAAVHVLLAVDQQQAVLAAPLDNLL